jgi:hypothetical protein
VDFGAINTKDSYKWFVQFISSESRILGLVNILFLLRSSGKGGALDNITNLNY